MRQFDEEMFHHAQVLEVYKSASPNQNKDQNVAVILNDIGDFLLNLDHYVDALIGYKQALESFKDDAKDGG